MQSYPRRVFGSAECRLDGRKEVFRDGEERGAQFLRHHVVFLEIAHRPMAKFLDTQARAMTERLRRAQAVQPAEIAAEQGAVVT